MAPDRRRIALLPTCLVDAVVPEVGVATVRVLRRAGWTVEVPEQATCCGQPAWNAGHAAESAKVARTTLAALEDADADVVVPAGSCATMIRVFWPELFEVVGDHDAAARARRLGERVRELSEVLADDTHDASAVDDADGERAPAPHDGVAAPVVYHHSCHMLRELGIKEQPESLLAAAGVERRVSEAEGRCCGFGGLFSVKQPELSSAMADDVLDAAVATGADEVVGCDSSCLMHLGGRAERRGLPLRFRHLAEVLEETSDRRRAQT